MTGSLFADVVQTMLSSFDCWQLESWLKKLIRDCLNWLPRDN